MSILRRFKFFLWFFGHFKVALIGYLKLKLIAIDRQKVIVKIPLFRRSKNHLQSMYFGALAVGADVAGGLLAFYFAEEKKYQLSLAFKSFQADFIRRPHSDVFFICEEGTVIEALLAEANNNKERMNQMISIQAFTSYPQQPELIARFKLELSVKITN